MDPKLLKRIQAVKAVYTDVDGVLTDGSIFVGADDHEYKQFTVMDGAGAALARRAGLRMALISGRSSEATTTRARQMLIEEVYQGYLNKLAPFDELLEKHGLEAEEVAYIGDGLVDVPVLETAGLPISVPNGHPLAKKVAVHITVRHGGQGAFQEVVEWILSHQGRLESVLAEMRSQVFKVR